MFSCTFWPSIYLLSKNVYLGLLPIFFVFNIMLHEPFVYLGDESLVGHFICKYFPPFCGLAFIWFMVSFTMLKLLSLIRAHLFLTSLKRNFNFNVNSLLQEVGQRRYCCYLCQQCVLPIVPSRIFRSLIHCEFISVYGVRKCTNFILVHTACQFSQHCSLKRLSFLHCIVLPPLLQIN